MNLQGDKDAVAAPFEIRPMIAFHCLGSNALLAGLVHQLVRHEATSSGLTPSLVLIGVTSVAEAKALLDQVAVNLRSRTILVGIGEELRHDALLGSLAELLESCGLLGAFRMPVDANSTAAGFIGPKKLAAALDMGWAKMLQQTRSYASWMTRPDEEAGAFLVRLISVLEKAPAAA